MSQINLAQSRSSCFWFIRLGIVLSCAATGALAQYTFISLDIPGALTTRPAAINNNGDVAGTFADSSGTHSFIRTADGAVTVFDSCGSIGGLNDLGEVVGLTANGLGCIRDRNGNVSTFTFTEPPAGFMFVPSISRVNGLNNAGESIVSVFGSPDIPISFLRSNTGSFTLLPQPPFGRAGFIPYNGLNNNGEAVGTELVEIGGIDSGRGFLLDLASGQFTGFFDLSTIPTWPGSGTSANAVNDNGVVVGNYTDGVNLTNCQPVCPPEPGLPFNIQDPSVSYVASPASQTPQPFVPPFAQSSPVGINQSGQVAGVAMDASGTHGYLANPASGSFAPAISLIEILPGPPEQAVFSVVASAGIFNVLSVPGSNSDPFFNCEVVIDPFTPGQTAPIRVTAIKIDQTRRAQVGIQATDMAGNVTDFDPDFVTVYGTGGPATEPIRAVPASEHTLMIANGNPGLERLTVAVNSRTIVVPLKANEKRILNLQAWMASPSNTVAFSGEGPQAAYASVVLKDGGGRRPVRSVRNPASASGAAE